MNGKKIVVKPGLGYIDTFLTKLYLPTIDFWNKIGFSPNKLTGLGLLSSLLCLYYMYHKNSKRAIIFLVLRCYFDYADGLLARKFGKVTKFGDYFDHIVDMVFGLGVFGILYFKSKTRKNLCILAVFFSLFLIQMGCVEHEYYKHVKSKEETTISKLRHVCLNPKILNFFDNGTLYLVIIFIIRKFSKYEN